VQQLVVLYKDLTKNPYATIIQRFAMIHEQFDYQKPMDQQNDTIKKKMESKPSKPTNTQTNQTPPLQQTTIQ
jgi:hypothetical protein